MLRQNLIRQYRMGNLRIFSLILMAEGTLILARPRKCPLTILDMDMRIISGQVARIV